MKSMEKEYIKKDLTPRDKARMIIDKFDTDGDRKLSQRRIYYWMFK